MEGASEIRPGRPRSEAAKRAILRASLGLLRKHGLAGVTAEAVAERARVSKATLYRWWPCAAATAMDAFFEEVFSRLPAAESADPVRDLRERARHAARLLAGDLGDVLAGLIAATHSDSRLAESFREHYLVPARQSLRRVVARAAAAGALRTDVDLELAIDVVSGAFFYRKLVCHQTTSPRTMDVLMDYVFDGLAPRPRARSAGARRTTRARPARVAAAAAPARTPAGRGSRRGSA